MRIAEIVATFPPYHGGMGYVCYHNARLLAERGHEVTVFTLDHRRLSCGDDPSGFKVVRLRTPLRYGDGGALPQLLLKLRGFDMLHLHYPFFGGAEYVWLASKLWGKKLFVTFHMDVSGTNLLKKMILAGYEPLFNRRILASADLVGALSIPHLKSSGAAGVVDWRRVAEIPNGVDTELFCPGEKDPDLVRRYGLAGKTVMLFVGNLQPFKGLDLLLSALAGIADPNLILLVVGSGYSEKGYRRRVEELGLTERVVFTGARSPEDDLPQHYRLADFLVLPSTHSESFGLVVLEAMASGKPVVVSSLPGPAALVDSGVEGHVARVGDVEDLKEKIRIMAGDKEGCRRMGGAARMKTVERYGWPAIGDILEKEISLLFNTPASPSHTGVAP